MDQLRKKTTGEAGNPGEFGTKNQTDDTVSLLGSNGVWVNGGTGNGITVVESPVGGRRNYWIRFDDEDGYLVVNPQDFEISDPDRELDSDRMQDRLFIGLEGEELRTQYSYDTDPWGELMAYVEDLSDEEMERIEDSVRRDLTDSLGEHVTVEFSSNGERWDDVVVSYDRRFPLDDSVVITSDHDGTSLYTTVLMETLEHDDETYKRVLDGEGADIIWGVLQRYNVL